VYYGKLFVPADFIGNQNYFEREKVKEERKCASSKTTLRLLFMKLLGNK
jgi:hypothetical protein